MTTITRNNYHDFCTVPELTPQEREEYDQFRFAITVGQNGRWGAPCPLLAFVLEETAEQHAECERVAGIQAADWSDMVEFADAYRQLRQAELEVWRKWKARHGEAVQLSFDTQPQTAY